MLPYTLVELINQLKFSMTLSYVSHYLTYIRYGFFCAKFYLLFLCNYKFRRDFFRVFEKKPSNGLVTTLNGTVLRLNSDLELNRGLTMKRNVKKVMFQRMFSSRRKRSRTPTTTGQLTIKRKSRNLTLTTRSTRTNTIQQSSQINNISTSQV